MPTTDRPAGSVLITGASSGIGKAVALKLAQRGSRLALLARNRSQLESVAARCEDRGAPDVRVLAADVGVAPDVEACIGTVLADWGGFDLVIHSAGVAGYGLVTEMPHEAFDRIVRTNVSGSANVLRLVIPAMRVRDAGTVMIIGSIIGHLAVPYMSAYTVSKWGLRALTRTASVENRDRPGIRICYVSLASVKTPIYVRAASYTSRAGKPPPPRLDVDSAADAVLRAAARPRRLVHVGAGNITMLLGFNLLPGIYDRLVTPLFRLLASRPRTDAGDNPGNLFQPSDPAP
ncbi:MAG TPA: SDR family oxidoreductase [Propionibacteriaceae bacterium]|nr:SDR family oxidoreductase [Propionibacteriaceae bacterium]